MKICPGEKKRNGTSLVAPWLRLCLCNAGGEGSIPGWRIKILCVMLVQAYQPAPRPAHPSQPPKAPVSQYLLAVKILPPLLLLKLPQYSMTSTLEGGHMGTLTRGCVCVCANTPLGPLLSSVYRSGNCPALCPRTHVQQELYATCKSSFCSDTVSTQPKTWSP